MSFEPYTDRLNRFRQLMEERELDSFLIAVPENRYYLSGYQADDLLLTESSGTLLITQNKQLLLTDFRYEEAAKQEALGFEVLIYKEGLATLLPDVLADLDITRLGLEAHYLTYQRYSEVEKALRAARPHAEVVAVEGLVEQMRVVKEPLEIERIKASLRVTERVLAAVWETLATGRTEKEVAWEIERRIQGTGRRISVLPTHCREWSERRFAPCGSRRAQDWSRRAGDPRPGFQARPLLFRYDPDLECRWS